MAKVLITGAAGYLGSQTAVDFINAGHDVIGIDNFLNSDPVTYELVTAITGVKILSYDIDLTDKDDLKKVFELHPDVDAVIHFAALKSVPESVANPLFCFYNNNQSTHNLLWCCEKYGVNHFVFSSSCSVYGGVHPKDLPVDENTPLKKPESPYGYTKQNGEYLTEAQTRASNLKSISLRYFNPVGAHTSGKLGELPAKRVNNLVPLITQKAAGIIPELKVFGSDYETKDGSCIRDYIHVQDISRAHLSAYELLTKQSTGFYEVINLGSGKGVTVFEMLDTFERVTRQKLNYTLGERRKGDVPAIYTDAKKAEETLNWRAEYTLDDVMQSAYKWQQTLIDMGLGIHKM